MAVTDGSVTSDALAHVQKFWAGMQEKSPIYRFLLSDISILSATNEGSITARLTVKPVHLNSKGTLHGAVSTCLTDWAGGMAIAATGREKTGISTDIHTSFVSTACEGDVLEKQARAVKVGSTLAFTNIEIGKIDKDGRRGIVASGSHTKFVKL